MICVAQLFVGGFLHFFPKQQCLVLKTKQTKKEACKKDFPGGSHRCSNHLVFFRGLYCLGFFFVSFCFFADAIHTVRLQTEPCIPTPLRRGLRVIRRDVPADTYQRMSI